jgi:hypothetical protein
MRIESQAVDLQLSLGLRHAALYFGKTQAAQVLKQLLPTWTQHTFGRNGFVKAAARSAIFG